MTVNGEEGRASNEAADWLARLNKRSVAKDELERFYAWRRRPGNAEAFDHVETLWRQSRGLGDDRDVAMAVREALERPRRAASERHAKAGLRMHWLAGALLACCLAVTLYVMLATNEAYRTAVGEQRLLTLEDGTRLRPNTDSHVEVDYSSGERRVELVNGEAFFDVAADATRPFLVSSGALRIRSIGTRFDVRRITPEVEVALVKGRIAVSTSASAHESILTPGQIYSVHPDGTTAIATVDTEELTSWTAGRLVFNETPLSKAIAEANRYSRKQIRLEADDLADERVDGSFDVGDTDAFVSAITGLFPLESKLAADGTVLLVRS